MVHNYLQMKSPFKFFHSFLFFKRRRIFPEQTKHQLTLEIPSPPSFSWAAEKNIPTDDVPLQIVIALIKYRRVSSSTLTLLSLGSLFLASILSYVLQKLHKTSEGQRSFMAWKRRMKKLDGVSCEKRFCQNSNYALGKWKKKKQTIKGRACSSQGIWFLFLRLLHSWTQVLFLDFVKRKL